MDNFFLFVFLSHLDVYCQSCRIIIRISLSISSFRLVVHSLRNIPLSLSIICQCMLSLYQKTLSVCKPLLSFYVFLPLSSSSFSLCLSIGFLYLNTVSISLCGNCFFLCFFTVSSVSLVPLSLCLFLY